MTNHKRHVTKWLWAHVTRKRLIVPFTYDFVWNVQTEAWFEHTFKPLWEGRITHD